jgi:predicted transcriptional regulator
MKYPKIVSREAISLTDDFILYLEKDDNDEIHYTLYKENFHMTQKEIADEIGYTESAICQILKLALNKLFYRVKRNNKDLNPIELTALIGKILNVKTDTQYKKYFQSLPTNIKNEVISYAVKKRFN